VSKVKTHDHTSEWAIGSGEVENATTTFAPGAAGAPNILTLLEASIDLFDVRMITPASDPQEKRRNIMRSRAARSRTIRREPSDRCRRRRIDSTGRTDQKLAWWLTNCESSGASSLASHQRLKRGTHNGGEQSRLGRYHRGAPMRIAF